MQLRKFRHSCLLVDNGDGRVLVDPGGFSQGFEELDGLTGILVTHQHPDHLDTGRLLPLLDRNPNARLVTDPGTAGVLRDQHGLEPTVATAGDVLDLGVRVEAVGDLHAEIHPDIPRIPNVGYLLDGRLLHPGDALVAPEGEVEVLALPTMAPWMRMAEAVEFLRAVQPATVVPIHEALLATTDIFYNAFRGLGPDRTELRVIDDGQPVEV